MSWIIGKQFTFEAAHRLPCHDGKCQKLHGHSFVGTVYIQADALIHDGPKQGMVLDYGDIKKYLTPLIEDYLDHHYLNETTQLESPTSEALAQWIYERLKKAGLPRLAAVRVNETCTSTCLYIPGELSLNSGDALALG